MVCSCSSNKGTRTGIFASVLYTPSGPVLPAPLPSSHPSADQPAVYVGPAVKAAVVEFVQVMATYPNYTTRTFRSSVHEPSNATAAPWILLTRM